jgi:chromosome segregation ATPase
VIEPAEGKVKEAITKLRQVEDEIVRLKDDLEEKTADLSSQLKAIKDPINSEIAKQGGLLKSYIDMVFEQLSATQDRVAHYQEEIFAVVERQKLESPAASLTEVLAEAEKNAPELLEKIKQLKAIVENQRTTAVLERFLYEYPISKTHEKEKKIRRSAIEDTMDLTSDISFVIEQLSQWLNSFEAEVVPVVG